jgi:group I intron endonuclease
MMQDVCSVYEIVNKLDGMRYIGITKDTHKRFIQHCSKKRTQSYIASAITKHGKDSFELNVLLVSTRRYCLDMEAKIIKAYNTVVPNGYNFCGGGEGPTASMSGDRNPMFGKQRSKESVAKSREGILGKNHYLAKEFIAVSPTGETYTGKGLALFCLENGLHNSNMAQVARGLRPHSKGWTVSYVDHIKDRLGEKPMLRSVA